MIEDLRRLDSLWLWDQSVFDMDICPICQVYIFMRPGAAKLDAACLQTCRLWKGWPLEIGLGTSSHHFQVWAIRPVLTRLDIRTGASTGLKSLWMTEEGFHESSASAQIENGDIDQIWSIGLM